MIQLVFRYWIHATLDAMPDKKFFDRLHIINAMSSAMTDDRRAYLARGLDSLWHARRSTDGETICSFVAKCDTVAEAERLGFILDYK